MELENIQSVFSINESLFLLNIKFEQEKYLTFWLENYEKNYMPLKYKNLLVFKNLDDAKLYAKTFNFMKNNKGERWLSYLKVENSIKYDLDLLGLYSNAYTIKNYHEKEILFIFNLISDYMFLTKDDFLYEYLIEDKDIWKLKEDLNNHLLWNIDIKKSINIDKICADKIKNIRNYFLKKISIYMK